MCLGSGGGSKPALQARTTPAVTAAPADESAKSKTPAVKSGSIKEDVIKQMTGYTDDYNKSGTNSSPTSVGADSGINY